ncbi:MAG: galactose-1-phosphate uridylyltransferase, partial [Candidatus Latescibacteria bacterium]|nr:galactose-1-phosphate uridylyltransferase [Candidatus Latescibacterota bacterium]
VLTFFERIYGPEQFGFENVSLLNPDELAGVFDRHTFSGIIDFAAKSLVGESQEKPRFYFENNVLAFRNLVAASGDIPIVKSSTAATYGEPDSGYIPLGEGYQEHILGAGEFDQCQLMPAAVSFDELLGWYKQDIAEQSPALALGEIDIAHLKIPTNVYGITKVMDERLLVRSGRRFAALRYFNAAGADRSRLIGEDHDPETHLIPIVLQVALGQRPHITVFGDDYDTLDGTAVRDYVSVPELADAHVLCLDKLVSGAESMTYNLGSSKGFSVREIIKAVREVTGHAIPEILGERRSGDPATLIANADQIKKDLGWQVQESLLETIESAWHWHRLHPQGYLVVQEERFNPFWNRWVNVAAHRGNRPWRGETQSMDKGGDIAYEPECYLCPGNTRVTGDVNPNYEGVWSFTNDFSSLVLDAYETEQRNGPYASRTSRGVCEVVVYGPNHSQRLSTLSVNEIANVVDAWADIYARLGEKAEIAYPLIFENRGDVMGNSQPHPHGQVYAYGEIPDLIVKPQLAMFAQYKKEKGGCFVCDANDVEVDDGRRILVNEKDVVAYVPFAAQFPYDVMIMPKRHVASLLELGAEERLGLADALQCVLTGLDGLFDAPYHYTLALLQAPTDGVDYGYHMQIQITSLLRGPGLRKHVVGADIFGNLINPSDPNVTAEELRHAMAEID